MFFTQDTKVRQAKPEDLPAVVRTLLAAINKERLWTNFVPAKGGQDAAYMLEIETLLKEHLDASDTDWVIEVVDLADGKEVPRIVAVAVWDMTAAGESESKPREVKTAITDDRLRAYIDTIGKGRTNFFDRYPKHMYLQLLATHPEHRNKGYAKDLVNSYVARAKKTGGVLTTIGGPLGYVFFSGMGFHDLGPITLPPSSAGDAHIVKAMSLQIQKEERRQSLVDSLLNYISS